VLPGCFNVSKLINTSRKTTVAAALEIPVTAFEKMRGLLGRDGLSSEQGMLFRSFGWVHTFGMRFAIDLIFLDSEFRVVAVKKNLIPNRFSPLIFKASIFVELASGGIQRSATEVGDQLQLIEA
jgi:uncharacterized membrane protein (UPF0127 family)